MTSHRTASKLLLTAFLATLITGIAAAQSVEITSPSDNSYQNESFKVDVQVSNLDSSYDYNLNLNSNASISGSRSDISEGDYQFTADPSSDDDGPYSLEAVLNRQEGSAQSSSNQVHFNYDTQDPSIDQSSIETVSNPDGSVEVTWESKDADGELGRVELWKSEEKVDSQGAGGTSATKTLIDDNEERSWDTVTYYLLVYDQAGNSLNHTLDNVDIEDGEGPDIKNKNPGDDGYVNSESVNVEATAEDLLSGVKNISLSVNGENNSITEIDDSEESSVEITLDNLEDGSYTPEMTAYDQQGNKNNVEWEFTVDTQSPSPSASLTPDPDEQGYISTETPIGVDVDSDEVSPTGVDRVVCYVDDPSDYGYDFGDSSTYEDGSFRCGDLNPSDYSEGEHSIFVKFYDRAGNEDEQNLGSYTLDTEEPQINSLEISPEYTNKEPNVTVSGSDSGSGLEDVEYMFSDSVNPGEGSDVSANFEDGQVEFKPNLRNKEDGEYTLYVRVQDGSGKWSDLESDTFTLDRGALPNPALQTDTLNITSGGSTSFEVTVENNGKVPLMDAGLEFGNGFTGSFEGVSVEGESSETYSVSVSTEESFGQRQASLELVSETVSRNITVPVNVRASEEQRERVDSRIEDYNSQLSELKSDLSRLEEEGASKELIEKMSSDIDRFESNLDNVKSATLEGDYYKIASELDTVNTTESEAVNTTSEVTEDFKSNQRKQMILIVAFITLVLLGGAAVLYSRSEYYIDAEDIPVSADSVSMESFDWDETVEKVEEKLDSLLEGEEGSSGEDSDSDDSDGLSWD